MLPTTETGRPTDLDEINQSIFAASRLLGVTLSKILSFLDNHAHDSGEPPPSVVLEVINCIAELDQIHSSNNHCIDQIDAGHLIKKAYNLAMYVETFF